MIRDANTHTDSVCCYNKSCKFQYAAIIRAASFSILLWQEMQVLTQTQHVAMIRDAISHTDSKCCNDKRYKFPYKHSIVINFIITITIHRKKSQRIRSGDHSGQNSIVLLRLLTAVFHKIMTLSAGCTTTNNVQSYMTIILTLNYII